MTLRPGKPSLGQIKSMLRLDSLPSALANRKLIPRLSREAFLRHALKGLAGLFALVVLLVGVAIVVVLSGPTEMS